jgi:hypothetical protein
MTNPIGFIPLREAADMVGRKVYGLGWRPLDQLDSVIGRKTIKKIQAAKWRALEAIWCDPHIDRVITMIAEHCEAGEIAAAYQSVTGADDLDRGVWRSPAWRTYFTTGTIDLDLPLLGDGGRPTGDGFARCRRQIFVRKSDLDRCLAGLAKPATTPKRGRKPHDWSTIEKAVCELMNHHGDFSTDDPAWNCQARLEGEICDRFGISKTALREHLPAMLDQWRSKHLVRN